MEWVKVTTESVRSHMAVELIEAYDKWIVAYPEKAGRLEEIVSNVRTEFRDAIKSVPRNRLNEDPETLPVSAVRHCENICMYEMAMEVGVQITQDGRTLLTNAQIYLRQIPYGRYRFYEDEEDTGIPLPSCNVPDRSSGRALGNLVALLLGVFLWCLPARAAWIKPGNETEYVPVNYDITEQSLGGHLAGIDGAIGRLGDTNSLYSIVSGLPSQIAALNERIFNNAYYQLNGSISQNAVEVSGFYRLKRRLGYLVRVHAFSEPLSLKGNTIYLDATIEDEEDECTDYGPIYAQGRLIIEDSLTLGDDTWTELPDVDGKIAAATNALAGDVAAAYATTGAVGAVSGRVAAIEADYATSGDVAAAVAPLATTASVAAVSGRVDAIEADYVVSSDIAGFASTQDVASVAGRVGELENGAGEYWCKWTSTSLSITATNWIPTNWPARTVWCFVTADNTNTAVVIAMPNWKPQKNCALHLLVNKPANAPGFYFRSANGENVSWTTSTSATFREIVIAWRADIQQWLVSTYTISLTPYYIAGERRGSAGYSALPEDGTFAPVVLQE
jgi:hypothetical protein